LRGSLGGADAVGVATEAAYALVAANRSAMDKNFAFHDICSMPSNRFT
jgi:hypothetical protein